MTNCLSGSVFLSSFKKDFFSHLDQIMCLFKATPVSGLGTNYKNLLEQKYTRENYATQHKTVMFWRNPYKNLLEQNHTREHKNLRIRGIEPRSVPWEGTMIPLHQMRLAFYVDVVAGYKLITLLLDFVQLQQLC